MSDAPTPESRHDLTPPCTDPERPRWMMTLAIALMVLLPAVGQILMQHTDLKATVYRFSWTMYSR